MAQKAAEKRDEKDGLRIERGFSTFSVNDVTKAKEFYRETVWKSRMMNKLVWT